MSTKNKWLVLSLIVVVSLVLSACGGASASAPSTSAPFTVTELEWKTMENRVQTLENENQNLTDQVNILLALHEVKTVTPTKAKTQEPTVTQTTTPTPESTGKTDEVTCKDTKSDGQEVTYTVTGDWAKIQCAEGLTRQKEPVKSLLVTLADGTKFSVALDRKAVEAWAAVIKVIPDSFGDVTYTLDGTSMTEKPGGGHDIVTVTNETLKRVLDSASVNMTMTVGDNFTITAVANFVK